MNAFGANLEYQNFEAYQGKIRPPHFLETTLLSQLLKSLIFFFVCVFVVVVMVTVVMVLVVVVMIVLVIVVDCVGIGCGSVGDCVLFPFISYVFKGSFYFKQCCNMAIHKKQQQKNNSKTSYIVCIHAVHCLIV